MSGQYRLFYTLDNFVNKFTNTKPIFEKKEKNGNH